MSGWPTISGKRWKDPRRGIIEAKGYGKNWPKQRAAALKRDNYTCTRCGYVGKKRGRYWNVHVHHKRKIAWFVNIITGEVDYEGANHLDNLETLCQTCHKVQDGHANNGFARF